jgi:hypothetical protein
MTAYVPGLDETDPKKIIQSLRELAAGRSNAVGTVTLTANSATTVVTTFKGICAPTSVPILVPTTASAGTEFGAGSWRISSIGIDTFTITHVNSATADRTFLYVIVG